MNAEASEIESLSNMECEIILRLKVISVESLEKAHALQQTIEAMIENSNGDVIRWGERMPKSIALVLGDVNHYLTECGNAMDTDTAHQLCHSSMLGARATDMIVREAQDGGCVSKDMNPYDARQK